METTAIGGMAVVSLAELGVQKATDTELKRFSQQKIDEHTLEAGTSDGRSGTPTDIIGSSADNDGLSVWTA
jgi:hypothetical protein